MFCLRILKNYSPNKTKFIYQSYMELSTISCVKIIQLKTCGQLYKDLKRKNPFLYRKSPVNGLEVSVEYVDTFGDNKPSNETKTILAIHGNPGNHKHFNGLIEYFKGDPKIRLIVPNMPDFTLTRKTMAFWHSNEERVQLIRDFLNAININEIDCLISHSAGIHPISLLWSDPKELKIKSIGIFCPQYTIQKFYDRCTQLSFLGKYKFLIALMDIMRPDLFMRGRFPLAFADVNEFLYFVLVHSNIQVLEFHKRLDFLRSNQLPTLFVYGENDKLIRKEQFERLYQRLGADIRDVVIYSEDKSLEKDSQRTNWIKVLCLKGGGHFAYSNYNEETAKHLENHLFKSKL